ncbi:hypothetical protein C8Q70DRAFT_562873 [Cubamyces menziesii]|uniref:DUF6534 domain-containing protein n=1 Tax=Trametes cubensis TaxID=1111947 RepID=A0AAD7TYW0_9APHY|nr:hypothetical protein C8Q70DRAFT_562873 [Cubamyces menziesii]KAJ8489624.1 hypothetical protein ONZ51_g2826 [Trametes cubensis]
MASNFGSFSSLLETFKNSIGAWLVGTFLTTALVGMLLQQTIRYFRLYPGDPFFLKAWVIIAVILQLVTTAMVMHTCYYYLVTYYLNPTVFLGTDVLWTAASVPLVGSINNLVSESFFARRVYMIGHRFRVFAYSAMVMIIASCGFYIAKTVEAFTLHQVASALDNGGWLPTVASALLLAGDIQLTTILVYALHQGRSGIKRTDSMVDTLIVYALSSGALICVLNVVSLVLSVVFSHSVIFATSTLVTQTVYTNSFVVALNTRQLVRTRGELAHTNLDTGVVLGENGSGTAIVNQVDLPLTSMVFAEGPSRTQLAEGEFEDKLVQEKDAAKGIMMV